MGSRAIPSSRSTTTAKRPTGRKTFTGCWTCRARKLKCDETYPHCNQCTRKNLACEGYSTRLQWLPCETGSGESVGAQVRTTTSQRRQIVFSAPKSVFNDSELDQFLFDIDEDEALTSRTQLRGPFGVFTSNDDAPEATLSSPTQSHVSLDYASEEGNASQFLPDEQGYVHDAARQYLGLSRRTSTASYMSEYDGMWPALPPGARVFPSPSPSFLQLLESQFPVMTPAMVDDPPIEDDADFPSPSDSFALVSQPSPFFMKPETRFLLNHYIHQVVNIFTMVENAKSPWKSIHLPRAMQGSGELEVIGATSHTRKALLNAILSVSAYCLSNRYGHGQVDQMEKWRSVGHQLRFQAVKSLQTCVTENISSSSKPKYKELLAAMLSMVSIDVASGETSTCLMHLAGSESFIRSTKGWKMKYSSKARSLHRIFYYLRVIHASTKSVEISKDESASPPVKTVSDEKPTAKSWLEDDLANSEEQASSTEFIYGIPPSLLVLLGKATDIVQQLDHVRRAPHELDNATASRLADACDQLEAEILDWPVDSALSCLQDLTPETRSIIEHQTRAFHQAIVIYFSSHVRAMHSRYMKPYVEAVISHAEAIEEIKRQHKVTSGPLFWPCFIAAAEAVDEDLQQRFIRCYRSLAEKTLRLFKRGELLEESNGEPASLLDADLAKASPLTPCEAMTNIMDDRPFTGGNGMGLGIRA